MSLIPFSCFRHFCRTALVFFTSLGLGIVPLLAVPTVIPIRNPGFESPFLPPGQTTSGAAIPDWRLDPADSRRGVYHPLFSDPPSNTPYRVEPPEGFNVGWIYSTAAPGAEPVSIGQQLESSLQGGWLYQLDYEVGDPLNFDDFGLSGFPGYRVDLLAGETVTGSDENGSTPTEGSFASAKLTADVPAAPPGLDHPLAIRLSNLLASGGREVDFDRFFLTRRQADSTPSVRMNSGTTENLTEVWAAAPDNVWAVGANGTILHYDGNADGNWSKETSPVNTDIFAIHGSAPNRIFALAKSDTFDRKDIVLQYNGSAWTKMADQPVLQFEQFTVLTDLWVAPSGEVIVSGGRNSPPSFVFPGIFLWRGSGWQVSGAFGNGIFGEKGICTAVWGFSRSELYTVLNDKVFRFDGFGWTETGATGAPPLWALKAGRDEVHLFPKLPSNLSPSGFRHWVLSGADAVQQPSINFGLGNTSSALGGSAPDRLLLAGAFGSTAFNGPGLLARSTHEPSPQLPILAPVPKSNSGLRALTEAPDGSVFAVGTSGTILGFKLAPRVLNTSPRHNARNVSANDFITIELDPGTIGLDLGTASFSVSAGGEAIDSGVVAALGHTTLQVAPRDPLPSDTLINIRAEVRDTDGALLQREWSFTTEATTPPPPTLVITDVTREGDLLCLAWSGAPGPIRVQESVDLLNWFDLEATEDNPAKVSLIGEERNRFVRIATGSGAQGPFLVEMDGSAVGSAATGNAEINLSGDLLTISGTYSDLTTAATGARLKVLTENGLLLQLVDLATLLIPDPGLTSGLLEGNSRIPVDNFIEPYRLVLCLGTGAHPDGELSGELTIGGTIVPPPVTKPVLQAGGVQEPVIDGAFAEAVCAVGCECDEPILLDRGEAMITRSPLFVEGRGEVHFLLQFTYRSFAPGSFGGWHWQFQECLFQDEDGNITRNDGRGHIDTWVHQGGGNYANPTGWFGILRGSAEGWILRETDGFKRHYDRFGYLQKYEDRFGNEMRLIYDWPSGGLVKIVDAFKRVYEVVRDGESGEITAIRDFTGREILFGYNEEGLLASITTPAITGTSTGNDFPAGRTERFTYLNGFSGERSVLNGKIATCTSPEEVATGGEPSIQWAYGTDLTAPLHFNKVIAVTKGGTNASGVPAGGTTTIEYFQRNAEVPPGDLTVVRGAALVTYPEGNRCEHRANERGHRIETCWFTMGLRPDEPEFYKTTWTFDEDGQVTSVTFPEGNRVVYTRQAGAPGDRRVKKNIVREDHIPENIVREDHIPVPARGGSTRTWTYSYDPVFQQLREQTDPRGHTTTTFFDYQEGSGLIPETETWGPAFLPIVRGIGDLNGDGVVTGVQGNPVQIKQPTVTLEEGSNEALKRDSTMQPIQTGLVWNSHGQLVKSIHPEGDATVCTYHPENDPDGDDSSVDPLPGDTPGTDPAGYLASCVVDAETTRLTTEYSYDPAGNRVRILDPRGVETHTEFNQQNEPVVVTRGADVSAAEASGQLITGEGAFAYQTRFHHDHNGRNVHIEQENRSGTTPGVGEHVDQWTTYDILGQVVMTNDEIGEDSSRVMRYRYDQNQQRVETTLGEGNSVQYSRDERNLVHTLTRGAGSDVESTVTYSYDRNGNRTSITDAADNDGDGENEVTIYRYDGHNRIIAVINPIGTEVTLEYDANSNLTRRTTRGHPANQPEAENVLLSDTEYTYDEVNRLRQVNRRLIIPEGQTSNRPITLRDGNDDGFVTGQTEHDANSRVTFRVDDDGETTEYSYDGANRMIATTDPARNIREYVYDQNGNIVRATSTEVNPDGLVPLESHVTLHTYDQLDRLVRVVDPVGQTTRHDYDSRDNRIGQSDPVGPPIVDSLGLYDGDINDPGNTTTRIFDGLNRLLMEVQDLRVGGTGEGELDTSNPNNPDGQVTLSHHWDRNSNSTGITDDNGNRTTYIYDDLDRQTGTIHADGAEHSRSYDADDNVIQVEDENGSRITHHYDAANRRLRSEVERGPGVTGTTHQTFGYDGRDLRTRTTDGNGDPANTQTCEQVFDSLGRAWEERQNGRVISRSLTGDSDVLQRTCPGGRVLDYTYDELNRLKTVRDATGPIAAFDHIGPERREIHRQFGNGVVLSFLNDDQTAVIGYDGRKRPIEHRVLGAGGGVLDHRRYTYSRADHRTGEERVHDGQRDIHDYDSTYRVASTNLDQDGTPGAAIRDTHSLDYTYDGAGNRRKLVRESSGGPSSDAYAVNAVNQYTEVGATTHLYDNRGNLIDNGRQLFAYDFRDRITSITDKASGDVVAGYLYDAQDRRMQTDLFNSGALEKSTTFSYNGWQVCEEQDADTGTTEATYVHGSAHIDDIVQMKRTDAHPLGAGTVYPHQNARHDVVAVTDSDGELVQRVRYDDFGNPTFFNAAGEIVSENDTGIPHLFQGRRFDSESGLYYFRYRYYSPALGRFLQRDPVQDPANVGNQYTFVGNGPVSNLDPMGLNGSDNYQDRLEKTQRQIEELNNSMRRMYDEIFHIRRSLSAPKQQCATIEMEKAKNREQHSYMIAWGRSKVFAPMRNPSPATVASKGAAALNAAKITFLDAPAMDDEFTELCRESLPLQREIRAGEARIRDIESEIRKGLRRKEKLERRERSYNDVIRYGHLEPEPEPERPERPPRHSSIRISKVPDWRTIQFMDGYSTQFEDCPLDPQEATTWLGQRGITVWGWDTPGQTLYVTGPHP